jgi:hypothetical protein
VETVGVFDAGQKIALHTLGTQVLVARIALDALPQYRRIGLCTNGATGHLDNDVL